MARRGKKWRKKEGRERERKNVNFFFLRKMAEAYKKTNSCEKRDFFGSCE